MSKGGGDGGSMTAGEHDQDQARDRCKPCAYKCFNIYNCETIQYYNRIFFQPRSDNKIRYFKKYFKKLIFTCWGHFSAMFITIKSHTFDKMLRQFLFLCVVTGAS